MRYVARHDVGDTSVLHHGYDQTVDALLVLPTQQSRRPSSLGKIVRAAIQGASLASVVEPSSGRLRDFFRMGSLGAAAAFLAASLRTGTLEVVVGDRRERLSATGPLEEVDAESWRAGVFFSILSQQWQALDGLLSPASMRACAESPSKVTQDPFQLRVNEALEAVCRRSADSSSRLTEAMEALETPPTAVSQAYVDLLMRPLLRLAEALSQGEAFEESLEEALLAHRTYWGGERAFDLEGCLALGPLALATLAQARGLSAAVKSEYLPQYDGGELASS